MPMAFAINIPPLTSGDRLTRREFERRYAAMPDDFKAELIEGVVYVASPVRYASHGAPADGIIRSQIFPGLNLNVPALLAGDLARVLATVQAGLQTDEHAAFVQRIQAP